MGNSLHKRAKMDQKLQKSVFEMDISPFRILLWNALAALLFQVVVFLIQLVLVPFCPEPNIPLPLVF